MSRSWDERYPEQEEKIGRILLRGSDRKGSGITWVVDVNQKYAKEVADIKTMNFHIDYPNYSNKNARFRVGLAKKSLEEYMRGIYFLDSSKCNRPENKEASIGQVIWVDC